MHPNRRTVLASSPALLLALSACSTGSTAASGSDGESNSSGSGAAPGAFPVTVKHVYGSTKISKEPSRIATIGWSDHDVLASFGVLPVGATKITWGGNEHGSTDWFDKAAEKIDPNAEIVRYDDSDGTPVAEIAKVNPDLVLGVNSGLTEENYDKLTKIADTVAYPELAWGTPWEESVRIIGKAIGRPDEAEKIVKETNNLIDEAVAKYPKIKGKTAAWASISPTDTSKIDIYTSNDLRAQMLTRFGLETADIVTKHSDGERFFFSLSAEKARKIDADVLIFYVQGDEQLEKIKKDPLLGQIPAIKNGTFVASADNSVAMTMSSPSPLSMEVAVTEFLPQIAEALKGNAGT